MKLEYIRSSFDGFSSKASELSRQLSLGGIAIIWIFKGDGTTSSLPNSLYIPLYLFACSLFCDLLQYFYGAVVWGWILRKNHDKKDNVEIVVTKKINFPTWALFVIKILLLISGYLLTLNYLVNKI